MAEQLTLLDTQGWWTCPQCKQLVDPHDIYCCAVGAFQSDHADWHRQKYPARLAYIEEPQDNHEAHVMALPNTRRGQILRKHAVLPKGDDQ